MKNDIVLGIDFGTQSLKVGVYTVEGKHVYTASASYPTYHRKNGYSEQNANDWWGALQKAMQYVTQAVDSKMIKGISLCATSSTVVLTDESLNPTTPAQCWMDQRATAEEEEINSNQHFQVENHLLFSGKKTSVEWMTTKSLWLKKHYDLTGKRIVEQIDWINYQLTGELVASKCNASCKWNYVDRLEGFSESFFKEIGLEGITEHWPSKVLSVGDQVGNITSNAAEYLGLVTGVPVFQGGIDAHIGMIGSGALEPGQLSMITGTSFVHLMHHDKPVFNDSLWGPYDSPLLEEHWLLEGGQLSCGSIISWFLQEFYGHRTDKKEIYKELEMEINKIDPGCEGLLVLDSWKGNRTPYKTPYATGAFVGLTLSHNKYHIYRAILEAIAFGTKNVIRTMNHSSIPVERIIAGGGGTHNACWMQIISDVIGLPISIPKDIETGSKGAAIIASYGLGFHPTLKDASISMVEMEKTYYPDMEKTKKYDKLFEIYLHLNQVLFPIMKRLKNGGGDQSEQHTRNEASV
ncbi:MULTISPECIES: FGGY-family carbohydrate kinase [Peribacillus]|uniref:FGGY-family carbohydrate kinase n=1 Tax=Peribacillus TaxID=2675229 RepID=UPI0028696D06|nr:FGGY-family carbohydrate kinase [Peribacillus sp. R9-11]WMX58630.1 FGGY-family carbohydrate kinase [Peribacillus sp. R9-11]